MSSFGLKPIAILFVTILVLSQFIVISDDGNAIASGTVVLEHRTVTLYAPAVAQTDTGLVGVLSTVSVTVQTNGSGHVFVDTMPLTDIDMQGSARLAVRVAGQVTNINTKLYDFFFVIRSNSSQIGGPSAGGVMTVATIAALENWNVTNEVAMTGMINPDWSIGPVGGIFQKAEAVASAGAKTFLVPEGQSMVSVTEWVWETVGGVLVPVQKTSTIDLRVYAKEHWGMNVFEVSDVRDAVTYYTGYTFERPPVHEDIKSAEYKKIVRPMAESLISEAEENYNFSLKMISTANISSVYASYLAQMNDSLLDAQTLLQKAMREFDDGMYYTASSNAFQSAYFSLFVEYSVQFLEEQDKQGFIETLIDYADMIVQDDKAVIDFLSVDNTLQLECLGAAQQRISMAEDAIEAARSYLQGAIYINQYFDITYQCAYAIERGESALAWADTLDKLNGSVNASDYAASFYDENILASLAQEYISSAQEILTYVDIILCEAGVTADDKLAYANELLASSQNDSERGYTVAAILEALEAEVNANIAISLLGQYSQDLSEEISRAKDNAASAIEDTRELGIEPILSISYYEFGESLTDESPIDSLTYFQYSRMIARFSEVVLNPEKEPTASHYIGVIPNNNENRIVFLPEFAYFVIGVVTGLLSLVLLSKKKVNEL